MLVTISTLEDRDGHLLIHCGLGGVRGEDPVEGELVLAGFFRANLNVGGEYVNLDRFVGVLDTALTSVRDFYLIKGSESADYLDVVL